MTGDVWSRFVFQGGHRPLTTSSRGLLCAQRLPFIVSFNPHNMLGKSLLSLTRMEEGTLRFREVNAHSQGSLSVLDTVPHPSDTKS